MHFSSLSHIFRRPRLTLLSIAGILPVARAGTNQPREVRTSSTVTTMSLDARTSSLNFKVVLIRIEKTCRAASVSCARSSAALRKSFSISLSSKLHLSGLHKARKVFKRTVVGGFRLFCETATGKLSRAKVISNAFTASPFSGTRFVGAVASFQVFLLITIHGASPFYYKFVPQTRCQ